MTISVILPCLNESAAIPLVLKRLEEFRILCRDHGLEYPEIIVVDDGSTDGSFELLQLQEGIQILRNEEARGYGYSLKRGFSIAKGDYIAFLDMDATYDPVELINMLQTLREKKLGMVCGDRLSHQSSMPFTRRVGNKLFINTIEILFAKKVADSCTGMRIFLRELIPIFLEIPQNHLDYSLLQTLLFLKYKVPFLEVPIRYGARAGASKLSIWNDGWRFLTTILRARFSRGRLELQVPCFRSEQVN